MKNKIKALLPDHTLEQSHAKNLYIVDYKDFNNGCVVFPAICNCNDWFLFIETKYSSDWESAFREENDYPNCMITQILETVKFFRMKGVLDNDRRVIAIVSFPNLIEAFDSTFFSQTDVSELDILLNYNVLLRATNAANIISSKRMKFMKKDYY